MAVGGSFWEGLGASLPITLVLTTLTQASRACHKTWKHDQPETQIAQSTHIYNIQGFANFVNAPSAIWAEKAAIAFCREWLYGFFQNFHFVIFRCRCIPVRNVSGATDLDLLSL
jgi:hypothetical protein